jgi:prepilin-type N-terminal cleavage/methylation domain-containing protein
MSSNRIKRRTTQRVRGGFTLTEVAVATAIVGFGVAALMVSLAAGTRTNRASQQITQAVFLVQEIREWSLKLAFSDPDPNTESNPPGPDGTENPQVFVDDLDDLMGVTYSPPRDGEGQPIPSMAGWSETLTLTWRDPDNLTSVVGIGSSDIIHVQVDIFNQGHPVLSTGWLVARRSP